MNKHINLSENLEKLHQIAEWFDEQSHIDVEEGLNKVKEAALLIKESKSRLREIENEFSEIQADIANDITAGDETITNVETIVVTKSTTTDGVSDSDIPF